MIIESNTPDGSKTVIYDKDGNRVCLPIKSYDTETKEAEYYLLDDNGKIKMGEWDNSKNIKTGLPVGTRHPLTEKKILEGSYAEIAGARVE